MTKFGGDVLCSSARSASGDDVAQQLDEPVERATGVDDVLDEQDVLPSSSARDQSSWTTPVEHRAAIRRGHEEIRSGR